MRKNKLSLKYSKTVYMILKSDKKQSFSFREQVDSNSTVESTQQNMLECIRYNLNWDTHLAKLEITLPCYWDIIYRIRNYLSTNALKMIYFSLVYSHLQYDPSFLRHSSENQSTHIKNHPS